MSPEVEHRSTQKLFYSLSKADETTKQYYNQVLAIGYYVIHVNLNG